MAFGLRVVSWQFRRLSTDRTERRVRASASGGACVHSVGEQEKKKPVRNCGCGQQNWTASAFSSMTKNRFSLPGDSRNLPNPAVTLLHQ